MNEFHTMASTMPTPDMPMGWLFAVIGITVAVGAVCLTVLVGWWPRIHAELAAVFPTTPPLADPPPFNPPRARSFSEKAAKGFERKPIHDPRRI